MSDEVILRFIALPIKFDGTQGPFKLKCRLKAAA
jgi:hypothetical protein